MTLDAPSQLLSLAHRKSELREVGRHDVEELRAAAGDLVDGHGRATPALQEALYELER